MQALYLGQGGYPLMLFSFTMFKLIVGSSLNGPEYSKLKEETPLLFEE